MQIHDDEWQQKTHDLIRHVLDDVGLDHLLPMLTNMLAYSQMAIVDGWKDGGYDDRQEAMAHTSMAIARHLDVVRGVIDRKQSKRTLN